MSDILALGTSINRNTLTLNDSSYVNSNRYEDKGDKNELLNNYVIKNGQMGLNHVYGHFINGSLKDGRLGKIASSLKSSKAAKIIEKSPKLPATLGAVSKFSKVTGMGPIELLTSGFNIATAKDKDKAVAVEVADYTGGMVLGALGTVGGFMLGGPVGAAIFGYLGNMIGGLGASYYMNKTYDKRKERLRKLALKNKTATSNSYAFEKEKYAEQQYVNNAAPGKEKRPPLEYFGKVMKERGENNTNTSANLYAFKNKKYSAQQSMNNADPGAIKRPPLIYAGSVVRQRGIKNKDVTSNSYAFNNKKYNLSQYPKSHSASTNKRSAGSVLNRFVKRTINRPKPKRMYNKIKKALNKLGRFFGKRFANGGLIGSTTYGMIGEDGPEMIIPLSGQRRQRGLDLWNQAGDMLGVPKYAEGAIKGTKGTSALPSPKSSPVKAPGGKRKATSGKKSGTGRISVGNIAIELEGVASTDILKTLQEQKGQIAHEVKNILSEAMKNASRNVSAVH